MEVVPQNEYERLFTVCTLDAFDALQCQKKLL